MAGVLAVCGGVVDIVLRFIDTCGPVLDADDDNGSVSCSLLPSEAGLSDRAPPPSAPSRVLRGWLWTGPLFSGLIARAACTACGGGRGEGKVSPSSVVSASSSSSEPWPAVGVFAGLNTGGVQLASFCSR